MSAIAPAIDPETGEILESAPPPEEADPGPYVSPGWHRLDAPRRTPEDWGPPVYQATKPSDRQCGKWIYRASAIGMCQRYLLQLRLGMPARPVDADRLEMMEEGNLHEPQIIDRLASYGLKVVDQQVWATLEVSDGLPDGHPGAVIRGKADARVVFTEDTLLGDRLIEAGTSAMLEAKAIGASRWARFEDRGLRPFSEWIMQGDLGRVGNDLGKSPLVFAVKNRDTGRLEVVTTLRAARPKALADVVRAVEGAYAANEELPCSSESTWVCDCVGEERFAPASSESNDEGLIRAGQAYLKAKATRDRANARMEKAKKVLKEHYDWPKGGGKLFLPVGGGKAVKASLSEYERTSRDLDGFEADHPGMLDAYTTKKPSSRFTVDEVDFSD